MPKPGESESKKDYIERCMGDAAMNEKYPDSDQRYAVCQGIWEKGGDAKAHPLALGAPVPIAAPDGPPPGQVNIG